MCARCLKFFIFHSHSGNVVCNCLRIAYAIHIYIYTKMPRLAALHGVSGLSICYLFHFSSHFFSLLSMHFIYIYRFFVVAAACVVVVCIFMIFSRWLCGSSFSTTGKLKHARTNEEKREIMYVKNELRVGHNTEWKMIKCAICMIMNGQPCSFIYV